MFKRYSIATVKAQDIFEKVMKPCPRDPVRYLEHQKSLGAV